MTRNEMAQALARGDRYCVLTHRRPDGDTLGSAAALCLGLRKLGKTANILKKPELSGKLSYLHEGLTVDAPADGDVLIAVDVAARNMLPEAWQAMEAALRVDHHGTDRSFAAAELVDPEAAACGEIIYDVLTELGVALDKPMAEALYVAVSTDTGCFRFANTTAHTFAVAAACAAAGAELYPINQALFDTNSLTKLRLQSWMLDNAKFYRDGAVALCALPKEVEAQATSDDMDNISSFLRSIEGVKLCALIRETETGVKLSARSVPGYDSSAVCARFGGGGHKGAAGASFAMTLCDAEKAVEQALLAL